MVEFPTGLAAVNYEQLEAEFHAGLSVERNLDISLTTLAHLIMAAQYALLAPNLASASAAILRDFVNDARAHGHLPEETGKLIAAAWQ